MICDYNHKIEGFYLTYGLDYIKSIKYSFHLSILRSGSALYF